MGNQSGQRRGHGFDIGPSTDTVYSCYTVYYSELGQTALAQAISQS